MKNTRRKRKAQSTLFDFSGNSKRKKAKRTTVVDDSNSTVVENTPDNLSESQGDSASAVFTGASPVGDTVIVADTQEVSEPRVSLSNDTAAVNDSQRETSENVVRSSLEVHTAPNIDESVDMQVKLVKKRIIPLYRDEMFRRTIIWKPGEEIPFLAVSRLFEKCEETTGRLELTRYIVGFLMFVLNLSPEQMGTAVCLIANEIAPPYEGIELGIGDSILLRAISETTGRKVSRLKKEVEKSGDIGVIARESRATQRTMFKPKPLTATGVLETYRKIAMISGSDTVNKKKDAIKHLLISARESESQYIVRQLQGKLRIHVNMPTVLVSIGQVYYYRDNEEVKISDTASDEAKEAGEIVKRAYSERPSLDTVLGILEVNPLENLQELCGLIVGTPVQPMLAKPIKRIGDVIDKFLEASFTCEYKYDGERAQIHYERGKLIKIFSRNLEDNSGKFPDILGSIEKYIPNDVDSFVLDSEIVAFDRETGKIRPFQILSTRQRKAVNSADIKIQVAMFVFDMLFFNGKSLISETLTSRRSLIQNHLKFESGIFELVKFEDFGTELENRKDPEALEGLLMDLLRKSVSEGCEGLMVKSLDTNSTYEVAKRSQNWIKLKKDYLSSLGDSIDVVPIGAYHGSGKRTACFNDETEEYESICKIGTGFSDVALTEIAERLRPLASSTPKAYYRLSKSVECDVYFEPTEVWEIKAADLSVSPVHQAALGMVDENKGIALRFPRFLRLREDKSPENCTKSTQIVELYKSQSL